MNIGISKEEAMSAIDNCEGLSKEEHLELCKKFPDVTGSLLGVCREELEKAQNTIAMSLMAATSLVKAGADPKVSALPLMLSASVYAAGMAVVNKAAADILLKKGAGPGDVEVVLKETLDAFINFKGKEK